MIRTGIAPLAGLRNRGQPGFSSAISFPLAACRRLAFAAGLIATAAVPALTQAADGSSYPTKPVRMIIPFAAGGATDTVVRIVANRLPDALGQQVVIDNRTGAGGLIGTEIASQATADGYTLLATGTPHVIVPHLYKKIAYDPLKDFEPIMEVGSQPYGLTVHPSLGVSSVKELILLAKKNPGNINYASSGNGGAQHLFAAMFVSMAGIDMVHVPYKGSGLARADLLGGQIKVGCLGISSIINQHKAGQLRIIAVTSGKRSPELPDIASIAETVPGYDASLWTGLFAPRGTPAAAVKRIYADVAKLLQSPAVKSAFDRVGTYPIAKDPREFRDYVKTEFAKWGKVVRDVKLQIN
jgi:tripartite-type tricarboxylate transporter receptor subunit TctC